MANRAVGCSQLPAGAPVAGGLSGRVRAVQVQVYNVTPRGRCPGGLPEVPCLLLLASWFPEAGLSALNIADLPLYSVGHR
jgi:primosomal replication protein N